MTIGQNESEFAESLQGGIFEFPIATGEERLQRESKGGCQHETHDERGAPLWKVRPVGCRPRKEDLGAQRNPGCDCGDPFDYHDSAIGKNLPSWICTAFERVRVSSASQIGTPRNKNTAKMCCKAIIFLIDSARSNLWMMAFHPLTNHDSSVSDDAISISGNVSGGCIFNEGSRGCPELLYGS